MMAKGKKYPYTISVNVEQYQMNLLDEIGRLEDRPKSWVLRKFIDDGSRQYLEGIDKKETFEKEYETRSSKKK